MKKRDFIKTGILGIGALALSKKSSALEYYPNPSDRKWAVLYGTWCGSSRDAGVWISEGMNGIANVFDVRENPDLSSYDHIIIGGSIRSSQISDKLQDYIKSYQQVLKSKLRGLFVVCGNRMQEPEQAQYTSLIDNHLAQLCGVSALPSRVFLGRVTYGLMDEDSRNMLQGMDMPEYDNLKRSECMEFGKTVFNSI